MTVRPARTQIRMGIRPVWLESSLSAWRKLVSLATHWGQAKTLIRLGGCPDWSESSLGAQSFCWFCHEVAHFRLYIVLHGVTWLHYTLQNGDSRANSFSYNFVADFSFSLQLSERYFIGLAKTLNFILISGIVYQLLDVNHGHPLSNNIFTY